MRTASTALMALLLAASGCGGGGGGSAPPAATPPPTPPTPAGNPFLDVTAASNLTWATSITPPSLSNGELEVIGSTFGGAAAGDCDLDGDVDLFVTYGDTGPNRLYLNQLDRGNPLQFDDAAFDAGVAFTRDDVAEENDRHSGPTFADMDGDGNLDLFLGGLFGDPNRVFLNQGDCTFTDVSAGSGLDMLVTDNTISAGFGDYDLDGDLDLFLTHWGSPDDFPQGGESEHLFRNISTMGNIRFENVSWESGVTDLVLTARTGFSTRVPDRDFTFTPTFARINDDEWPDIVVAADFKTAQVMLNEPGAPVTFADGSSAAVHAVSNGMGSALGDFDFDGDLDWFVTSIYASMNTDEGPGNFLYENPGGDFSGARFTQVPAVTAAVANGGWGWGTCFLDIDNDTDLDLYHTNGWQAEFLGEFFDMDRSRVFISTFAEGTNRFVERSTNMGLDDTSDARGVVCADFDNDGDVDILQLTNRQPNSATLWANDRAAAGNNFLRVQLIGLPPNTEAAGARIFVRIGTRTQMREIMIGSNYTSQNPATQIFGLGSASSVDALWVEWPARVASPGDVPVQPIDTTVPLAVVNPRVGAVGETLIVCHPDLTSPPDICF